MPRGLEPLRSAGLLLAAVALSLPLSANDTGQDHRLCQRVSEYHDWQLTEEGWVSQQFEYQRFRWRAAHGYPVKGSSFYRQTDYDKYSTETLMRLAQDGDKAANLELAQRLYGEHRSGSIGHAEPYCYRAVVDGFSAMSRCMMSVYGEKLSQALAANQGQLIGEAKPLMAKLLAWVRISKQMADPFAWQFAENLAASYRHYGLEEATISAATEELRQQLAEARRLRQPYKDTVVFKPGEQMPALWRYLIQQQLDEQAVDACLTESSDAEH